MADVCRLANASVDSLAMTSSMTATGNQTNSNKGTRPANVAEGFGRRVRRSSSLNTLHEADRALAGALLQTK